MAQRQRRAPSEALVSPEDMRIRLALIEPVLATAPGTPGGDGYRRRRGKGRVSEATVRRWLARHENSASLASPASAGRTGEGRAIPGSRSTRGCSMLGEATRSSPSSPSRSRAPRCRPVDFGIGERGYMMAQACIGFVAQRLRAAGAVVSRDDLIAVCRPSAEFVRAERQARLVDVHRNDAGRFAAKYEPRIRRDRSHLLPIELVCGDVAHLDVLIRRADGSTATPKAVAFQDLATNRLFYRLFLLRRGNTPRARARDVLRNVRRPELGRAKPPPDRQRQRVRGARLTQDLFELKVATEEVGSAEPGVGGQDCTTPRQSR